jgi:hypothetical protein
LSALRAQVQAAVLRAFAQHGVRVVSEGAGTFDHLRSGAGGLIAQALADMEADGLLRSSCQIRCSRGRPLLMNLTTAEAVANVNDVTCDEDCPYGGHDFEEDDPNQIVVGYVVAPAFEALAAPPPGVVTVGLVLDALASLPRDRDVREVELPGWLRVAALLQRVRRDRRDPSVYTTPVARDFLQPDGTSPRWFVYTGQGYGPIGTGDTEEAALQAALATRPA